MIKFHQVKKPLLCRTLICLFLADMRPQAIVINKLELLLSDFFWWAESSVFDSSRYSQPAECPQVWHPYSQSDIRWWHCWQCEYIPCAWWSCFYNAWALILIHPCTRSTGYYSEKLLFQPRVSIAVLFLALQATEAELKQFFTQYGSVKDAKIIMDRAGVSKGWDHSSLYFISFFEKFSLWIPFWLFDMCWVFITLPCLHYFSLGEPW